MKNGSQFRIDAEYALLRSLLSALELLPHSAAIAAGRLFARGTYVLFRSLRQTGERNLRLAFPEMTEAERAGLLRASFDSMGRQLGEFSQFRKATPEDFRNIAEYDPESVRRFEDAKARGRGMLLITGHLGGWEILAFAHAAFGNPIHYLARPIANRKVERLVRSIRARYGNQPLDKRDGLAAMRILKGGGIVAALADLNSLPQEGIFSPFFGRLACTTGGVAALALPTNATLFPVFAPWVAARKRYVMQGGPPLELIRTGDFEHDLCVNTARVAATIERTIRKWPGQWLWIHDRWHARPRPGDRVCTDYPPI